MAFTSASAAANTGQLASVALRPDEFKMAGEHTKRDLRKRWARGRRVARSIQKSSCSDTSRVEDFHKTLGHRKDEAMMNDENGGQDESTSASTGNFQQIKSTNLKNDTQAVIQSGYIQIDPLRYEVKVDQEQIELTLTQFRLLSALVRRPGMVFTPTQLSQAVAGMGSESGVTSNIQIESKAIKNHIYMIRRKLGRAAKQLETVRGVGYRMNANESVLDSSLDFGK